MQGPAAPEPPHRPSPAVRARVKKDAALLTQDRRFPQRLVTELTSLLLHAPDGQVERLRPFALADAWGARLFAEHSDVGALQLPSQIGQEVLLQVEAQQGRLVQADASLGLLVAAFADAAMAVKAALGVSARLRAIQAGAGVRAAVHQGRCIALTRDGQIQYFGETLERGVALLGQGEPGSVVASTEIREDRDAARVLLDEDVDRVIASPAAF